MGIILGSTLVIPKPKSYQNLNPNPLNPHNQNPKSLVSTLEQKACLDDLCFKSIRFVLLVRTI